MNSLSSNTIRSLAPRREDPVVSILLPTERAGPATRKSPIRFKNLLQEAKRRLESSEADGALIERLRSSCEPRVDDHEFWQHQTDGLAVFCDPEQCSFFSLPSEPPEFVSVGNRFCVKPLLPMVARDQPFFLLALSGNRCDLFRGDAEIFSRIHVKDLPKSLEHALRFDDPERSLQFHTRAAAPQGNRPAVFHGQGSSVDDRQDRFLRYFQICDRALSELLAREKMPLILATVDENVPIYREANDYSKLVEDRWVSGNPDDVPDHELRRRAREVAASLVRDREEEALAELLQFVGTDNASTKIEEISLAIRQGKVRTAFVAADRARPGSVDPLSGEADLNSNTGGDLLNELACETLLQGGEVLVMPWERIPGGTGAAAIYRY